MFSLFKHRHNARVYSCNTRGKSVVRKMPDRIENCAMCPYVRLFVQSNGRAKMFHAYCDLANFSPTHSGTTVLAHMSIVNEECDRFREALFERLSEIPSWCLLERCAP